jgi:hypothetical protein
MKRMVAAALAGALVVAVVLLVPFVALGTEFAGTATLHQIDESGIEAEIGFLDTGTELFVTGRASGLDPGQAYISLVYDNGSVPSGPLACAPSDENDMSFEQMLLGPWQVESNGNGKLSSVKAGPSYVPLKEIGSVSVRLVQGFQLQACGKVHR